MNKVLIIGATSAIVQETAKIFAVEGNQLFIVGRNEEKLKVIASDLAVRGAKRVDYKVQDFNKLDEHESLLSIAIQSMQGLDIVLIGYGTLGNQKECEENYKFTERELVTNFLSIVSLLTYVANYFEKQRHGIIAVISSVAGDRGRQSNYVYGTAKGGLNIFLQGLRNRLCKSGVTVITIKPGFVDTPMTANLKKGLLFVKPELVAKDILKSIKNKKDIVYTPFFWRGIMAVIKFIPENFFKRLKL